MSEAFHVKHSFGSHFGDNREAENFANLMGMTNHLYWIAGGKEDIKKRLGSN